MKNVNDGNFETEVLKAEGPVLVDFWAEWCGPCKALAPILDQISGEFGDRLSVAKVNIDEALEVGSQMGIRGVPTLILFKDGQKISTLVGNKGKSATVAWINQNLA